ncbi:hypothetical protein ACEWY4_023508 [Coilia grayii]|uniref:Claudin n=1 Tax=Coilia grayii TaxID=363190 RepID=A0ABD1J539_9TELE
MSSRQICALLAGLVGLGAIIGATVSNEWKSTSRASSVITATWVFQGLWMSCGGNAIGAVHCRPHLTIFKLEGYIQVCRGLMIAAVCLGFFGSIFALIGMKCTRIGGTDQVKARIAFFAGFNFILSAYVQGVRGLLMVGMALGFFAAILCFIGMECTYIGGSEKAKDKLVFTGAVFHFVGGVSDIAAYCLYTNRIARTAFAHSLERGVLRYGIGTPIFLGLVGSFFIILGAFLYAVTVYRVLFPKRVIYALAPRTYMAPQTYMGSRNKTPYYGPSYYGLSRQSRSSRNTNSYRGSRISQLSRERSERDAFV